MHFDENVKFRYTDSVAESCADERNKISIFCPTTPNAEW